jgi:anti-sigma factor RsiW
MASWDLSQVYLGDPRSGAVLCRLYPQDKQRNADGRRRSKVPLITSDRAKAPAATGDTMAPLLRKLVANYAATGMPPAYLPKDEGQKDNKNNQERIVNHE